MNCRVNTLRKKTARLLLESLMHKDTTFVTLTYSDENQPQAVCDGDLVGILYPQDLTEWLNRFRKRLSPTKFRYFAVGEYGSKSWRPHYHALLFGVDLLDCDRCLLETWGKGHVSAFESNIERVRYVANYTTKKITQAGDMNLNGRPPEFARMSLKPGLGAPAVEMMAGFYHTKAGAQYLAENGDVARTFRYKDRVYPFDHYMLQRFRDEVGVPRTAYERNRAGPPFECTPDYTPDWKVTTEELSEATKKERKLSIQAKKTHGTL